MSRIHNLRAYQKCIDTKDLSLQDCINICQVEDAIRMQVLECRPESVNTIQSAQTAVPVHKLQHSSKQSPNFNRHKNKAAHNCYYCGAPNWTREHSKVCKAKNSTQVGVERKGTLVHYAGAGTPLHILEAQDYNHSLRRLCKTTARVQRLHNTPHHTSCPGKNYRKQSATASRLYKSPD